MHPELLQTLLAQTASTTPPTLMDFLMPLFQSFGIPGIILGIVAYTCRKLVIWGTPHAEKIIEAWITRQYATVECQKKLTDSTIEIQRSNQTTLEAIQRDMPRVCQGFKEFSQKTAVLEKQAGQTSAGS